MQCWTILLSYSFMSWWLKLAWAYTTTLWLLSWRKGWILRLGSWLRGWLSLWHSLINWSTRAMKPLQSDVGIWMRVVVYSRTLPGILPHVNFHKVMEEGMIAIGTRTPIHRTLDSKHVVVDMGEILVGWLLIHPANQDVTLVVAEGVLRYRGKTSDLTTKSASYGADSGMNWYDD